MSTRKKCSVRLHAQAGVLVSWDKSRVLSLNSEKFSLFFFNGKTVQMKKFVTFSKLQHTPTTTRETHFVKRETKRLEQISYNLSLSLSLSLSVRARKTHLLWTKERHFKNVKREREGKERERVSAFLFLFGERKRKRERISILKSRDFLPFVLTLAFNTCV